MLEQFIYKNHQNEEMRFGEEGVFVNESSLRDYEWKVVSDNNRISNLQKQITTKNIPLVIACGTEEEGIKKKNQVFEVMEKDALVVQYGRIILGDYYLKCYCTGSKKTGFLESKKELHTTLTVSTDCPNWIRETTTMFRDAGHSQGGGKNLDYRRDYPSDYTSEFKNKTLVNENFVESNFRIVIYGPVINPTIYIAGHEYTVNIEISENEHLTIDSIERTIVLTRYDGTLFNAFGDRNKASYIFQKIPKGNCVVAWDGSFGFDVVLCEERSEPKWQ